MQNKLFLKAADICELLEVKQTSVQILLERYAYSEIGGTFILI